MPAWAEKPPIELDPDDPTISREERLRRSRDLIQMKMKKRQEALESMKRKDDESKRQKVDETKQPAAQEKDKEKTTESKTPGQRPPNQTPPPQAGQQKKKKEEAPIVRQMSSKPYVTFFLSPASAVIPEGGTFATACGLLDPQHLPVDSIAIMLSYPTPNLRPTAIHQNALTPFFAEEPECLVDEIEGTIIYRAKFKDPLSALEIPLITIEWEALAPAKSVQIRPSIGEDYSAAYWKEALQTETVFGVEDALAGTLVRITQKEEGIPQGEQIMTYSDEDLAPLMAGLPDQSELRKPTLWIDQPGEGTLEAGQWLVIDVGLDNPDSMIFDELRLAVRFDPEKVKLVDADQDNWIHSGLNVLDGPFHDEWQWTNFYENRIDPKWGYFFYWMGTNRLRSQSTGPIVRVFAYIKQPVEAPILSWIWNEKAPTGGPTTGLYLMGTNILLRDQVKNEKPSATEVKYGVRLPDVELIEKADPSSYRF